MKIEDVEKLMQDSKEALEYQEEVSKLLSGSLTPEQDQSALEELEALEKLLMEKDTNSIQIPKEKIHVKKEEIQEEIETQDKKLVGI